MGGDVEEPVADGLGCGSPQRAGEADPPCPAQQIVRGERELHPAVVVGRRVEGELGQSAGFGVPDDLLGSPAAAVPQIQGPKAEVVGADLRGVGEVGAVESGASHR
jgi:hypothetical protein